MSVLMEFAMFPTSKGETGSSQYVSRIIEMIRDSGYDYQLTPMGTIVETADIRTALELVEKAYALLEPDCERVYSTIKFDIRKGRINAMKQKIRSVEEKIGTINK
jgi:uncharacterized protein (TIGR00106 family)